MAEASLRALVEEVQIGADSLPLAVFHITATTTVAGVAAVWHP